MNPATTDLQRFADEQADLLIDGQTTDRQAAIDTVYAFEVDAETALRALLLAVIRKRPKLAGYAFFGAVRALDEGAA